jgi:hypothetical protein
MAFGSHRSEGVSEEWCSGWRRSGGGGLEEVDRSGRRRRLFSTKAKWEKAAGRLRLARVLGLELIGRADGVVRSAERA